MSQSPAKSRRFRLRSAALKEGVRYVGLSFSFYTAESGFINPVVSEACGEEMDYGKLHSYLFRRFGYPNSGWDGYKELTKYVLSTPLKDLFLCITPNVGCNAEQHFSFVAPYDVRLETDAYARRFMTEWQNRAFAWRELQGLPEWMPQWMEFCRAELREAFPHAQACQTWQETVGWMQLPFGEEGSEVQTLCKNARLFHNSLYAEYEQVEPQPEYVERCPNWREWDDADPLRKYAEAAYVALTELKHPVRVRDSAIDAFGEVAEHRSPLKEPLVAGYPSGALANAAPTEFAQLQRLVLKLGNGNSRRGISKILAKFK